MGLGKPIIGRSASSPSRFRGIGIFPGLPRLEAAFLAVELAIFVTGILMYVHLSGELDRFIDARLDGGGAGGPAVILASPAQVWIGQEATPAMLAARLRKALYVEGEKGSEIGTFQLPPDGLQVYPGKASFFRHGSIGEGPAEIRFHNGHISAIRPLDGKSALQSYWLEPEVITTLSGYARSEQHLLHYSDVPKVLLDAIIATEDHRFFSHHGVNPVRIVRAAIANVRGNGPLQGGSTLTMQLARNLFLSPRRTVGRKVEEIFLALFLELRMNKQQIFELYANRVYLGQQGNFGIFGFGDAAETYFNKDVGKLSLPEAAFLAGLVRGPNFYSPYKYHDRALERRAFVLQQMVQTGAIKPGDAERAMAVPLNPAKPAVVEGKQEAYFEDMVTEQLRTRFTERELRFDGLKVYTTLDLDLQHAASEGARIGSAELDHHLKRPKLSKNAIASDANQPQFSLVAIDPHTGDLKALIGGRDYGASQLNHALARRQPGSSFKPFVYAAALSSGVDGSTPVITTATLLQDEPTQFKFGNKWDKPYTPKDYKEAYHGTVTVREALMDSLNVPTVSLAQTVGYDKVRNLAMAAGFNAQLEATPSIALGAYVATPMEVAGAYTIFANEGQYVSPRCILEVDDSSGVVWSGPVTTRHVLDPRVSYLMVSLLESVIDNGTGAGVRARGFRLPAAGKTGTSHDGWFAGFTSNLLAVVWVGYDDDRELNLTGAQSALPIWTEFMKRATDHPSYRNAQPFTAPPGVVTVPIQDSSTSEASLESDEQVATRTEVFIKGTEPHPGSEEELPGGDASALVEPIAELPGTVGMPPSALADSPIMDQTQKPPERELPQSDESGESNSPAGTKTVTAEVKTPSVPVDGQTKVGRLLVHTDPSGLEVFIDGKTVGRSPVAYGCQLASIPAKSLQRLVERQPSGPFRLSLARALRFVSNSEFK